VKNRLQLIAALALEFAACQTIITGRIKSGRATTIFVTGSTARYLGIALCFMATVLLFDWYVKFKKE
jgi:hypothetical protein